MITIDVEKHDRFFFFHVYANQICNGSDFS